MERHLIWVWLSLLIVTWGAAFSSTFGGISQVPPLQWLGSAVFFALIFLLPLFQRNQWFMTMTLSGAAVVTSMVFISESSSYILLIYSYLVGEVLFRLSRQQAIAAGLILMTSFLIATPFTIRFSLLLIVFMAVVAVLAYRHLQQWNEADARYDALLHEYRRLKRKSASDEKLARQEERTQIGREIHDRVGHKLTNLLMQLEVARMEADQESKNRFHMLKDLAKESLNETRQAVKAMNQDEIGGLPAIIRLIRKLEAENYIRIHFLVKNRAFSADLDVEQTVAVYRAVQEALTNVMRHSSEREASVLFESPGGSVFRFEVSNPIVDDYEYREGYGLRSMRERLKKVDGRLDILTYQHKFTIRGTLPVIKKGSDSDASHVTS
ncbi:sensor histidine kinase [Tenuibacillus multivorans]|nr:sensor histidine kinase [Tenuibacillus multivorans]GEL77791.1 hypothetical protein TMU01_20260 [Tenuibacillus multivorans]